MNIKGLWDCDSAEYNLSRSNKVFLLDSVNVYNPSAMNYP